MTETLHARLDRLEARLDQTATANRKPFRPTWEALEHVPADKATADLLAHVEHLERQIAALAEQAFNRRVSPDIRANVRGLVEHHVVAAVEDAVREALRQSPPQDTVARFAEAVRVPVAAEVMAALDEVFVFAGLRDDAEGA